MRSLLSGYYKYPPHNQKTFFLVFKGRLTDKNATNYDNNSLPEPHGLNYPAQSSFWSSNKSRKIRFMIRKSLQKRLGWAWRYHSGLCKTESKRFLAGNTLLLPRVAGRSYLYPGTFSMAFFLGIGVSNGCGMQRSRISREAFGEKH